MTGHVVHIDVKDLARRYSAGENISEHLRQRYSAELSDDEIIELVYDLQAGTYMDQMTSNSPEANRKRDYLGEAVAVLAGHSPAPARVLKCGVGEATTLVPMLQGWDRPPSFVAGFDLCWSRLAYARQWLDQHDFADVELVTATLLNIPYADRSFDLVISSHSLEPNGQREAAIMGELFRVAADKVVLFEPAYEFGGDAARARMDRLNYVRGLRDSAEAAGFIVLEHRLMNHFTNPLNPTQCLVLQRPDPVVVPGDEGPVHRCPRTGGELVAHSDCYFSADGLCVYPIIGSIPCLRSDQAIIASRYADVQD